MSTVAPSDAASQAAPSSQAATGPRTPSGKAVASRNATTHGLFARDVVLPSLGEDPDGYRQVANELITQLRPQNLLERHYVEKIAAASWRLRRLHRWQAQLFEDDTLTEDARLDRLDKVLRHETHLHRQIDTAVKMLNKDVPQLYARRVRDQVLLDMMLSERECRESSRDETEVDLETRGRLRRIHKATEAAMWTLSGAPLDTEPSHDAGNCQNELPEPVVAPLAAPSLSSPFPPGEGSALAPGVGSTTPSSHTDEDEAVEGEWEEGRWEEEETEEVGQNCQNEPGPWAEDDRRAFRASFPRSLPGSNSGCRARATG